MEFQPLNMTVLPSAQTPEELEALLGEQLRALRLARNIDQITLARRAGIGLTALKRLEAGKGSSLKTLISVVKALERESWLSTVAPMPTVNPLSYTQAAEPRQRARMNKPASGRAGP